MDKDSSLSRTHVAEGVGEAVVSRDLDKPWLERLPPLSIAISGEDSLKLGTGREQPTLGLQRHRGGFLLVDNSSCRGSLGSRGLMKPRQAVAQLDTSPLECSG
jgi:hypothetical protein